jgi:hypothetical protein
MPKKKKRVYKCCGKVYSKNIYGRGYYGRYLKHRRKRHPEAVAKAKEFSNQANYGQSAEEYDQQLHKQKDRCSICNRRIKNVGLHQDHTHKIATLKIKSIKGGDYWYAYNEEFGYCWRSHSRKKAVRQIRMLLRRRSRRGILCWHCNSGLRKWLDNPAHLRNAARYLEYWQNKQDWNYEKAERLKG